MAFSELDVAKASWDEFEVSATWAELQLGHPGLISGVVAPGQRGRMTTLLAELRLDCAIDPEIPDDR